MVLALFSFVGFESATTLGHEAVNPLRTIPRAVIQSAIAAGLFFILCAYMETLGMAAVHQNLGTSTAPLSVLATLAGVSRFGTLIDFGALVRHVRVHAGLYHCSGPRVDADVAQAAWSIAA